jgi:hypothetical protein
MATGFTQYFLENYALKPWTGVAAAAFDNVILELTSNTPDFAGAATYLTGGTASNYVPVTIDGTPDDWEFINDRQITNKKLILFPAAGLTSWANIQGWVIHNTAGDRLAFGHVTQGRIIDAGQRFKILPGGLTISVSLTQKFISDAYAKAILQLFQGTNLPAITASQLRFGKSDPTLTGDIGELVGTGYVPVALTAADFEATPANSRLRNQAIVDYDRFWNATVDTSGIKSAALWVSGVQYLCGKFSADASLNLKIGDNIRLPINSLSIVGAP